MDSSASEKILWDLINGNCKTLPSFLDRLDFLITESIGLEQSQGCQAEVIDEDFMKEITMFCQSKATIHFGKTLRDLKCKVIDKNGRQHEMWIKYIGAKMFRISDLDAPKSYIQDQVYKSLDDVVNVYIKHIDELSKYFEQMDLIKKNCTVVEPVRPTFKDDYRKIRLADRIWLHVEVSFDGSAKNLRLLGQTEQQHHKLQDYILSWDHDKDIATNVITLCALIDDNEGYLEKMETEHVEEMPECRICQAVELYDDLSKCGPSVPQPLCNNAKCGAYYHRSCLYTWLEGGRPPPFGVAIGTCPCCLQPIQCSEKDV